MPSEPGPLGQTLFTRLFEASPGAACVFDAELRMTAANPAWERAFDHGRPAPIGTAMTEIIHADDIHVLEGARRGGASTEPTETPIRVRGADGTYRARAARVVSLDEGMTCLLLREQGVDAAAWHSLIEQRELLARTESAARIGSWRIDLVNARETWSDEMYEILGLDPAIFEGGMSEAVALLVHPDDQASVRAAAAAARAGQPTRPVECRILRADGSIGWLHVEASPERDAEGRLVALVGFMRDITEQREAEVALRTSEEKFAAAFRVSPDAVNINRMSDGLYMDINEGFTALMGYTWEDVAGRTSLELDIWADPEDRKRLVAGLTSTGEVRGLEARFRRKDGSVTTALMSARVMELGGVPCIISITRDISVRKAAEEALRASELRFRGLFHNMAEGFALCQMIFDDDGRPIDFVYLEVNEAFGRITGLADVVGRRVTDVLPGILEAHPEIFEVYGRVTMTGEPAEIDAPMADLGLDLHISVFRPEPGCFAAVFEDISDRLRAEREILELNADLERRVSERTRAFETANAGLSAANEDLEKANEELVETNRRLDEATRAKSEFLASMSHELRTPLNSILGFSGTLLGDLAGPLKPEQRKQVRMINNSGRHLLALINDVLDLSKIEAGQTEAVAQEVDCLSVADSVCQKMQPLADAKGLDLTCVAGGESMSIVTDETKLEQILLNLVGNAVKFTDTGGVAIEVEHRGDEVAFVVEDTGRGVSPDDAASIFDEFYQGGTPDGGKTTGTGLGLTVSKRLADILGGRIEYESEPDRGSRFVLTLPACLPSAGSE